MSTPSPTASRGTRQRTKWRCSTRWRISLNPLESVNANQPKLSSLRDPKHESEACCGLSLRERVRKHSAERAKCGLSRSLLSIAIPRVAILTLNLALLLLAAGCQTASSLREAQDAFDRAAAAENAMRLDSNQPLSGGGADTMIGFGVARSGYASALLILNRITSESADKLRSDQLLGNALTLKALCEWRLSQYSQAVAT